ncbi:hypothetical protein [Sulfolobus spindle-shaped virus 6]|uniref:C2H2-type domain-containing protein n=1 Tax=Sulfolobus spindle-shaped virus 6 TaxID=693627 RepID=D1GF42_9VIRU|nr:hypothetical protein SSSV6_gp24 [Sulfolobus spindle-shaped virus 6]ACZ35743.1 hypothetical protein [Sulfolobus spindle-shaped virus 6]
MYQCLKCGKIFKYKREIKKHIKQVHNAQISELTLELSYIKFNVKRRWLCWSGER